MQFRKRELPDTVGMPNMARTAEQSSVKQDVCMKAMPDIPTASNDRKLSL